MELTEIVRQAGMSDRPAFYSGRGATTSDLDGRKLKKIHDLIKSEIGEKEADGYILMVAGMKELSATAFLNTLYGMPYSYWKFNYEAPGHDIEKDEDGNHNVMQGMATILAAMGRKGRDDTSATKRDFLYLVGRRDLLSDDDHRYPPYPQYW